MEFEYSLISEPPGDDVRTLKPLPCYGRGLPLIPLEELPLFQYLKRDYEMAQPVNASREVPSGIGRGSVSKLSGFSMEDSSDEDHNVVSLYWRHQKPLSTSNLNAGLEPSRPAAQGKNHAPCRSPAASHPRARGRGRGIRTPGKCPTSHGPAAAAAAAARGCSAIDSSGHGTTSSSTCPLVSPSLPVVTTASEALQSARERNNATQQPGAFRPSSVPCRGRGIADSWKRRLQQMLKQPQESQPSNNGARLRCPPHVSGPPPSCPGQLQMPPSSRHPALSKPRQECAFPPTKSFPRGKTAADAGRQAQGQSCRTSCPRKPIKKGSFDPKTFSHAVDLCSWVESLSNVEPHKHTTESGTELTDSNGDEFHRRVSIKPDSVYESFSSSSVSSTDLAYVSAVEATPAAPPVPAAPPAPEAVASVPENAQMSSLRGTEVLIKGLPKATTAEFVYYNTACFAAVDDVIISTDGDGTSADIILTKPYSASKLCQCLQAVLTLDGRSNRLEFSCLKQA
ncbi:uncharacterized protein LOC119458426 isoform X3 [Dermacentor silvarum]|uniref:uncharacterized protein LOC119458426 isoform X3 n=1 Tax=Dermacentor silvarum TaxID=543639 RepID=UPI00189AA93E|nr:uncharacterized protein LOC119458426 isoform X3 [Dermacentor silvarum]